MIEIILGELHYTPVPVAVTSDDWEEMLNSGEVQMVVGSLSYTGERAASYPLAGPYMTGELALLTRTTITASTTAGCLSKLRSHEADALLSDAVILLGMRAKSPATYTVYDPAGFGQDQNYTIAFSDTPAMSHLCRSVDNALPGFLENNWWPDFQGSFGVPFARKSQVEAEYQPPPQDIDTQWCAQG
jgi:ABC-type amino acid transport substrate-binding protein